MLRFVISRREIAPRCGVRAGLATERRAARNVRRFKNR
jgi:hypothetical protein